MASSSIAVQCENYFLDWNVYRPFGYLDRCRAPVDTWVLWGISSTTKDTGTVLYKGHWEPGLSNTHKLRIWTRVRDLALLMETVFKFIYPFVWVIQKDRDVGTERERKTENLSLDSFSKWPHYPGLVQLNEAKSPEFHLSLIHGWEGVLVLVLSDIPSQAH